MKEQFQSQRFAADSLRIISKAQEICARYAAQGYDLSLRQLYYQFVAADLLPNTEQNYKRLGGIISDARLSGMIDWDMIKDRGRETVSNQHFGSPAEILEVASQAFRIDTWADQPNYVEVMVEKQALEGVLEPVCRDLDIRFTANKGYSSSSALYETGKRLQEMFTGNGDWEDWDVQEAYNDIRGVGDGPPEGFFDLGEVDYGPCDKLESLYDKERYSEYEELLEKMLLPARLPHPDGGKRLHVIYLGDHDPSGIDMTRDVRERLELFSRCPVEVHRIALNMDQVRQYNPPENPAKLTDSRATDYIRKFGSSSWELDALEPSVLAGLVRDIVIFLRDDELHAAAVQRQQSWRDELKQISETFKGTE